MNIPNVLVVLGTESWRRWLPPFLEGDSYDLDLLWSSAAELDVDHLVSGHPDCIVFLSHQETQFRDLTAAREIRARGFTGTVICSSEEVVALAFDKRAMARLCSGIPGVNVIPILTIAEAKDALASGRVSRLVSKCNDGTEGKGMRYFESAEELVTAFPEGAADDVLIQEFVAGDEISLNAVCNGQHITFYPIVSKGMTEFNGTHPSRRKRNCPVDLRPDVQERLHYFGWRYLSKLNHRGIVELEFILADGVLYFLEINPRLAATMRLATVVTRRSLFADFLSAACGYPPTAEVVNANALGAEWALPPVAPEAIEQILRPYSRVWCSTNRITVAAPQRHELVELIAELTERLSSVGASR